jgi:CcmD family protein
MSFNPDHLFVLAVSLITWAGVFCYLLRIDKLTKALEREVERKEAQARADAKQP